MAMATETWKAISRAVKTLALGITTLLTKEPAGFNHAPLANPPKNSSPCVNV